MNDDGTNQSNSLKVSKKETEESKVPSNKPDEDNEVPTNKGEIQPEKTENADENQTFETIKPKTNNFRLGRSISLTPVARERKHDDKKESNSPSAKIKVKKSPGKTCVRSCREKFEDLYREKMSRI